MDKAFYLGVVAFWWGMYAVAQRRGKYEEAEQFRQYAEEWTKKAQEL